MKLFSLAYINVYRQTVKFTKWHIIYNCVFAQWAVTCVWMRQVCIQCVVLSIHRPRFVIPQWALVVQQGKRQSIFTLLIKRHKLLSIEKYVSIFEQCLAMKKRPLSHLRQMFCNWVIFCLFFSECSKNPKDTITERVKEMGETFCQSYSQVCTRNMYEFYLKIDTFARLYNYIQVLTMKTTWRVWKLNFYI
jgi:hypothetical protein